MNKKKPLSRIVARQATYPVSCLQEVQRWYQSAPGQRAAALVQDAVEQMSSDVFGYYALQLGELAGKYTLLQSSRISNCFSLAPAQVVDSDEVHLVADPAALPIEFDNIDLVVASHVLDCTQNPHEVLREIDRILVPEGHCILIGFNPLSLRGVRLLWKHWRKQEKTPALYSAFRLRDWFAILGFEVLDTRTLGFRYRSQPVENKRGLSWLRWPLQKYFELFGNVQLIHVRKKISKQIPIKPKLRHRPILQPGMTVNRSGVGKSLQKRYGKDGKR